MAAAAEDGSRSELKLLWLETLGEHLRSHVIPVATALGLRPTLQSLQGSVFAAIATPGGSRDSSQTLPLDSKILNVENLKKVTRSFQGLIHPQFDAVQSSDNDGVLMEQYVILVAVLATTRTGSRDFGLCVRDSMGEIPCEVVPPAPLGHCVVLLKKWNFVYSGSYGSYLEIEELVSLDQESSSLSQQTLPVASRSLMTVPDILSRMKSKEQRRLKDVNVFGRLSVISEPFRNSPAFMLILRIVDISDTSTHCHLITQSPGLLYLSRAMKLFEIYTFTHLKSAIMNKGRDDEATVLTTTSETAVERVSSDEAVAHLLQHRVACPGSLSPARKRLRREEGTAITSDGPPVVSSLRADTVTTRDTSLLSYKGVVTSCLLPEGCVYELDDRLILYLTHSNLSNQGRGLREGAMVEISNAHMLKIATPLYKKMSGFVCCPLSRVEVVHFSERDTHFKAFLPQNKLAQLLRRFRAMDVAWLTLVFLSLLKRFKKKREAFSVLSELCDTMEWTAVHQDTHSSLLRQPHFCPYLSPVDLSLRPFLPTLHQLLESCRERVTGELFGWRGEKREREGANSAGGSCPTAHALSVAVSATWSFGVIQHTDFPNPQVLVGRVCGNRVTGHMELCDGSGSFPVVVSIPYSPLAVEPEPDSHTGNPWLTSGAREGSRVVIREFSVIVERTKESDRASDTKYSFYLHPQNFKVIGEETTVGDDKKHSDQRQSGGKVGKSLYVYVKSKNCLKQQAVDSRVDSKCVFEALVAASTTPLQLQSLPNTTSSTPETVVLEFTSARLHSYIHNYSIYRLSCSENSQKKLLSLDAALKDSRITVCDEMVMEMVPPPRNGVTQDGDTDSLLQIGKLVSQFYLPKLQTAFPSQRTTNSRSEGCLVSFRGLVLEHSYRIDCDTTQLLPWQLHTPLPSGSRSVRHIVALTVRGIHCPNTAMIYCKYRSHESLPLGLVPGSIAAFHHFTVKSSSRSGNIYFVNSASSSITVESINTTAMLEPVATNRVGKLYGMTKEMQQLPLTYIFNFTQRLLQGCLSRQVVLLKATVVAVQHAFIQYQCLSCQCTMVDGQCRQTCPSKKTTLNTDARLLIQDGTGEAHLYVKDRVLPVALGMSKTEWADLLDLVHTVGQVSYTKSSLFKSEGASRPVTVREKAERLFLNVLTRPSLTRTVVAVCQPFLSPCEQTIVLGSKSHRVWPKPGLEYLTLSLPRLQLRLLALATPDPLSLSHKLMTLLHTTE